MKNYITPIVLAAAVGMCVAARRVERVVLTSTLSITPATAEELRLPVGNEEPEDIVTSLQALLEQWNLPDCVLTETDARSTRFHELVDREFLKILTSEERQELEILSHWRDNQKSAFYQNASLS